MNSLDFCNFQDKVINGVKIYSMSNQALEVYRKEARRDANIPRDILEIKLTAMIITTDMISTVFGKLNYKFGSFIMTVNPKTDMIETVNWVEDSHLKQGYMTALSKKLKENYRLLGLNAKGNAYIKESIAV